MILFQDILYLLEEMILSIIDITLILITYKHIYNKSEFYNKKIYLHGSLLMISTTIMLKFLLSPGRPSSLPPITIVCSYLFLGHYNCTKQKKILFSIFLLSISSFITILSNLIITPLQLNYLGLLLFHISFCFILFIIILIGKYQESEIPIHLWILLFLITSLSLIALCIMEYYIVNRENPYELTIEIPIICLLLFINISLFIFFNEFSNFLHESKEKVLLKQQLKMQNTHYKKLECAHYELCSIKHDIKKVAAPRF